MELTSKTPWTGKLKTETRTESGGGRRRSDLADIEMMTANGGDIGIVRAHIHAIEKMSAKPAVTNIDHVVANTGDAKIVSDIQANGTRVRSSHVRVQEIDVGDATLGANPLTLAMIDDEIEGLHSTSHLAVLPPVILLQVVSI